MAATLLPRIQDSEADRDVSEPPLPLPPVYSRWAISTGRLNLTAAVLVKAMAGMR
jgi:hypothetical protein